jgi:hypothetical protein
MLRKLLGLISFWGAILASTMLALNLPISGWAYILFLASNFATLYIIRHTTTPPEIEHQLWFFVVINIVGIFRWLV